MPSSIAHVPRSGGGKHAAEVENSDLRDLLAAIRDALDIPPGNRRPALLDARVLLVLGSVRDVLDGKVPLIPFETEMLRSKLAEDGSHHA
ncbi:hypothetical protein SCAB_60461 [Streptomyces scabiei 87.22]|uniref:Uncharacterized protein n=1 Tax=Streptomyces scabiei (strain 87.22) TaxID=680198 RepID=C9Z8X6_STRSW|nr:MULTISPECIES: hypothetical protein [Streptomyces]MBP5875725.1 hypothetical protein [Streptomyces sp. LBUM 1477]MDX2652183.1 hypothetical protein [Streptomyces scabiei]MDX2725791.1 hypothetical protein [Streptomyces scabiei]MDX2863910.1 hypothetical protein [Streptomyces scabiei]MDX2881834.1 hypothetical protein [Streptomyces scabiei]